MVCFVSLLGDSDNLFHKIDKRENSGETNTGQARRNGLIQHSRISFHTLEVTKLVRIVVKFSTH